MSIDLKTEWTGLPLKNPLVASSSPLTGRIDTLKRLEDKGIAAVVLPSIFEEQLEHEDTELHRARHIGAETFGEAAGGYFPELPNVKRRSDEQLELVRMAKEALSIPVIGSLNGHTLGGWTAYAQRLEEAGADALELNLYFVPADVTKSGAEVEKEYVDLVTLVRSKTSLPMSVKLSPFFSSPGHVARKLVDGGVRGLVLFNRFMQPDIDLERLSVEPRVVLSTSDEVRLPLRWIALLRGRLTASLAATSGVHDVADVLKLILAGADVAMMTSSLLKRGPDHVEQVLAGMVSWMEVREYASVQQMKGALSQENSPEPAAFERAHYMAALTRYVWEAGW